MGNPFTGGTWRRIPGGVYPGLPSPVILLAAYVLISAPAF